MNEAVAWICVTIMVLGIASCTWAVDSTNNRVKLERENACWDRGGKWETTGWSGAWCNVLDPATNP